MKTTQRYGVPRNCSTVQWVCNGCHSSDVVHWRRRGYATDVFGERFDRELGSMTTIFEEEVRSQGEILRRRAESGMAQCA